MNISEKLIRNAEKEKTVYIAGLKKGYNQGYESGYAEGEATGIEAGKQEGKSEGKSEGYSEAEAITAALIDRSIEEIVIPEGVTIIGYYAFGNCKSLERVSIPDSVTRLDYQAFCGCSALKEINIPENVNTILSGVFSSCQSLKEITIPEKVTALWHSLFKNCSSLERVFIRGTNVSVDVQVFGGCTACLAYDFSHSLKVATLKNVDSFEGINPEAKIYVPASLYDEWIAATNWSQFADHIMAIYTAPIVPTPDYISEGLLIEDGKLKGRGNCTDSVIVVPDEVTRIISEALIDDTTLDTLILPERNKGVLIDDYSVLGSRLRVIKNFYGTISTLSLYDCPLEVVSFLPSADWIYIGDFGSQVNPGVFDFTRHTSIPRLEIPEWFSYSIHEDTKILVPIELYDEWKADTNWTTLEQNIVCGKR